MLAVCSVDLSPEGRETHEPARFNPQEAKMAASGQVSQVMIHANAIRQVQKNIFTDEFIKFEVDSTLWKDRLCNASCSC